MRAEADAPRVVALLRALGTAAREETKAYLTGGATAVLVGWRSSTIDVDLKLEPERDELLRRIAELKEELDINMELASPLFSEIEPQIFRYPALDSAAFRAKVERAFA